MRRPDLFVNDIAEMVFHCSFHQTGAVGSSENSRPSYCSVHRTTEVYYYSQWDIRARCAHCPGWTTPFSYKCPVCCPGEPLPPEVKYVDGAEVRAPLTDWNQVNIVAPEPPTPREWCYWCQQDQSVGTHRYRCTCSCH